MGNLRVEERQLKHIVIGGTPPGHARETLFIAIIKWHRFMQQHDGR